MTLSVRGVIYMLLAAAAALQAAVMASQVDYALKLAKLGSAGPVHPGLSNGAFNAFGWAVIVIVVAACLLAACDHAYGALMAVLGGILLLVGLFLNLLPTAQYDNWQIGALIPIACIALSVFIPEQVSTLPARALKRLSPPVVILPE